MDLGYRLEGFSYDSEVFAFYDGMFDLEWDEEVKY